MKQKTVKELRDEIAAKLTIKELEQFQEMGELFMTLNSLVNREPGQFVVNPELRLQLERNGYSVTKKDEIDHPMWVNVKVNQKQMSFEAETELVRRASKQVFREMGRTGRQCQPSEARAEEFAKRLKGKLKRIFGKEVNIETTIKSAEE